VYAVLRIEGFDELGVDQMKLLRIGQRRIVLGRTEEGYVAFDDRCTHKGGTLADGTLMCGMVQCPWRGSQFDVHTGAVKHGPAKQAIATYGVGRRDGRLLLHLSTQDVPIARVEVGHPS
jgi:nitrite reductase/ring-hydroxylating ferredoxin subunit